MTYELVSRGKVRDSYLVTEDPSCLVMVASDRISAYDVVMRQGVPDKGIVLTQLSNFWFDYLDELMPSQVAKGIYPALPAEWSGRACVVRRADMVKVECVVRGYLAGSAFAEYQRTGEVFGHRIPAGLALGSELPEPLFTPTTKELEGHDRPMRIHELVDRVGSELAGLLEGHSREIYSRAQGRVAQAGLVLADTKFEFGFIDGELALCDEVLTPDSSRYWDASSVGRGREPNQLDKQILRDWLRQSGWDQVSEPPDLPGELIQNLRSSYVEIFHRLVGLQPDGLSDGNSGAYLGASVEPS
ncbi:MAG: phosphoribosylaminoimidazolesuccinocarboxamide synthase [Acidimicrobiales bacterium]